MLLLLAWLGAHCTACVACAAGMRGRHWDGLSRAVGTEVWPGEDLQLSRLLKAGILKHMDVLNVSGAVHCGAELVGGGWCAAEWGRGWVTDLGRHAEVCRCAQCEWCSALQCYAGGWWGVGCHNACTALSDVWKLVMLLS